MRTIPAQREYAPVPWWEWSGRMEKPEMIHQLDMMNDAGISEFIIFAVYGLEYPAFLSSQWFELVEFTAIEAEKRQMKIWIYDDLNWPSGGAGGQLAARRPDLLIKPLTMDYIPLLADSEITVPGQPEWCEFQNEDNLRYPAVLENGVFTNRTGKNGKLVLLYSRDDSGVGLHSSGAAGATGLPGYFDPLNPESVKEWMNIIHGQYKKHLSKYFGNVIKGFFTDEPELLRGIHINAPWTAQLPELFQQRFQYELRPRLGDLFFDGENAEQLRSDYWHLVAELFGESFGRQLSRWCSENNLLCTGHALYEEPILQMSSLACNGDIHTLLKNFSIPGCDLLGLYTCYSKEKPELFYRFADKTPLWGINLAITLKRTAATARYSGAKRVLCEAFGCRKWNVPLSSPKAVNDFLAVCGINMVNDNTLAYTASGFRNITGLHFYQPYWSSYQLFAQYSARVSEFAAFGMLETSIAVLYPASSIMAGTKLSLYREIEPEYDASPALLTICDTLMRSFRDYEFLYEDTLHNGTVSDGILQVKNAGFSIIIVPQLPVIGDQTLQKLQEFSASGGKVIMVGDHPEMLHTVKTSKSITKDLHFIPDHQLDIARTPELLPQLIDSIQMPLYRISGETDGIVAALRHYGNEYRMMIANLHSTPCEISLEYTFAGKMEIYSPDDGVLYTGNPGKISLAGNQSWLLRFKSAPAAETTLPEICTSPLWCSAAIPDRQIEITRWHVESSSVNTMIPAQQIRLTANSPWLEITKSGCFQAERELNPDIEPFYFLRCSFTIDGTVPDDLMLLSDADEIISGTCNGKELLCAGQYAHWDHTNRRYPLAQFCIPGENVIELRCRVDKWYSPGYKLLRKIITSRRIPPAVIAGTFTASDNTIRAAKTILKPGDITGQGFEEFAGKLIVSADLAGSLPEKGFISMALPGLTASVFLNGELLSRRAWSPYRFAIAPAAVKKGSNRLTLELCNTLGNLIKMYYGGQVTQKSPFELPALINIEME